jgi:hypothetical protein
LLTFRSQTTSPTPEASLVERLTVFCVDHPEKIQIS